MKEERIVQTLELINRCRGISKAKEVLKRNEVPRLKQAMRELSEIGINPVTIPQGLKVKYIPNLLQEYYRKTIDFQRFL